MSNIPRLAAASLSLFLTAAATQAATVTKTQSFSGSKSNQFTRTLSPPLGAGPVSDYGTSLGVFDLATSFQADLFDTNLGTLQSVQIVYNGVADASSRVTVLSFECSDTGFDPACESKSLSIDYTVDFGVYSQIGSVDEVSTRRSAKLVNQDAKFLGAPSALEAQATLTGAGDLAAYSGTGTFDLTAFFFPTLDPSLSCDPNLFTILTKCSARFRGYYGADFSVDLIYTYDDGTIVPPPSPVPLPAGAPLALAGLACLGWMRRREG